MWYGIGNTVIANPSTMRVGLKPVGRVMFYNGAVDIGQGSNTILVQILADALGLPMGAIDYVMGDTDLTADAGKTSASRQAFVSGNATRIAGGELRRRMIALAEARPDARLRLEDGVLIAADVEGDKRIDLTELPRDPRGDVLAAEGYFNPPTVPLDRDGQGVPYATYGFAAQIAEVEVDLALGTTQAAPDRRRARRRPGDQPDTGGRADPRWHRAGDRPRVDGGVPRWPDREPARLPDPDRAATFRRSR